MALFDRILDDIEPKAVNFTDNAGYFAVGCRCGRADGYLWNRWWVSGRFSPPERKCYACGSRRYDLQIDVPARNTLIGTE